MAGALTCCASHSCLERSNYSILFCSADPVINLLKDPQNINEAREVLREKFLTADVGITEP